MSENSFDISGKIAIVTGASRGLGKQMALYLAQAGAAVACAARTKDDVEQTAAEVRQTGRRALAIVTDVTQSDQVNALVEQTLAEFGKIDILVNNAGGGARAKPIWDITDEDWHAGVDLNLSSAFYCSRAVARHMVDRKQGKIINLASGYGLRGGRNNYMYCASKGGIVNLTRCLAFTLAQDNIQVNCIAPGFFPHVERMSEEALQMLQARERFQVPGRFGDPKELATMCLPGIGGIGLYDRTHHCH